MPQSVYLERSPAKINLYLKVLDKREDGFHNLETLFQAIELSDHLTFEINFEKGASEDLDFSLEIDSNSEPTKALGQDNIMAKAIEIYIAHLPDKIIDDLKSISFKIFLDKNIPLEAGLAGGSGNAAATLRVLNKFFEENFSFSFKQDELEELALSLGSDVPFCLRSTKEPRLYAESRGENFKDREFEFNFDQNSHVVLVKPDFGVSTAAAFKAISSADNLDPSTWARNDNAYFNSFESVVYDEAPALLDIHEAMQKQNADQVMLSGSGSTMLAFFKDSAKAESAYQELKKQMPENYFVYSSCFLQCHREAA